MSLKGGEALSPNIPSEVLANAMVDLRYYPFKGNFPENISTDYAEYQLFNVDNRDSNIGVIEVNSSSTGYRDLKNSYILVNYRIVDNTGAPVTSAVAVTEPLQSLLHFKDIKTYFDSRKVSDEHDDLYHYQSFHKTCLTEKNVGAPQTNNTVSSKTLFEDIYDVGSGHIYENSNSAMDWKINRYAELDPSNNGIDLVIKPSDGIWNQSAFIPSTTKLRIELVKNDPSRSIRDVGASGVEYKYEYSSIQLYLRVVYPTQSTQMTVDQRALVIPRMYPVLTARSNYFTLPTGSSTIKLVNVLSGSKPSCLVVQFVKQNVFNGSYTDSPLQADDEFSIKKLFVRVGTKRYPRNWEYGTDDQGDLQGANSYNEYLRLVKNENETELQLEPFIPSDQRNFSIWFFNTRENQETIYNRADDPTGMDSIEIEGTFNNPLSANGVVIVTALSNDVVSISPTGQADVQH